MSAHRHPWGRWALAGALAWLVWGSTAPPAAAEGGPRPVLFVPWTVGPGLTDQEPFLRKLLVARVVATGRYVATASGETAEALQDCVREVNRDTNEETCWVRIGQGQGAELMVTGEVDGDGRACTVSFQLTELETRVSPRLHVARVSPCGPDALVQEMDRAAVALAGPSPTERPAVTAPAAPATVPPATPPPARSPAAPQPSASPEEQLLAAGVTAAQLQRFRQGRGALDETSPAIAQRLLPRGFDGHDVLAVVQARLGKRWTAEQAEAYAGWVVSGQPVNDFQDFLNTGMSLTQYTNQESSTLFWVEVGLFSGAAMFGGMTALLYANYRSDKEDYEAGSGSEPSAFGVAFLGAYAGVILLGGVGVLIADLLDIGNVPPRFFETATKDEITSRFGAKARSLTAKPLRRPWWRPRITLAPWLPEPGSAGAVVGFQVP